MDSDTVRIKSEPPDDYSDSSGPSMYAASNHDNDVISNGDTGERTLTSNMSYSVLGTRSPEDGSTLAPSVSVGDNRNFTCLLCDMIFHNRDDLRRHLKVAHSSKNFSVPSTSTNRDVFSNYVNFRYTCSVCGARFKTFKNYLSHNMSHRGQGSLQGQFSEARLSALLGAGGKQSLNDYLESEDFLGSFTCSECKGVFLQRDSYAMHMMMRAMNETCQPPRYPHLTTDTSQDDKTSDATSDNAASIHDVTSPSSIKLSPVPAAAENLTTKQRCLEEVTCQVDQDEYLQSVLDKVFVKNETNSDKNKERTMVSSDSKKRCVFCDSSFPDQDSLAMHVMSDHTEQMSISDPRKSVAKPTAHRPKGYLQWFPAPSLFGFTCKVCGEQFLTRDNLAMHVLSHTQAEHAVFDQTNQRPEKRERDHDSDAETSPSLFKIMRKSESVNKPLMLLSSPRTIQLSSTHVLSSENLKSLCTVCCIHFPTVQEYAWHVQTVHGDSKDEPICLKKSSSKEKGEEKRTEGEPCQSLTRSKSFCVDESSRKKVVPMRPHSVGQISVTTTGDAFYAASKGGSNGRICETPNISESKPDLSSSDDKRLKKDVNRSHLKVPSNVDALSSQERKIIYSVFGDMLSKDGNGATSVSSKANPKPGTNVQKDQTPKPPSRGSDITCSTSAHAYSTSVHQQRDRDNRIRLDVGEREDRRYSAKKSNDTAMCKFCEIVFLNKAIYYLHMGLHNVNNPWQCNVCGKICENAIDFTAHVIHM